MNSKKLIQETLHHKQPLRVPIDFGGTGQTGIHVSCVEALRQHYGLPNNSVIVSEPYQMLGFIDDDLKEIIGIDTKAVDIGGTMFGFRNENWKEWRTPWEQVVLVAEQFNTTTDADGNILIYPQGDMTVPPSAKMPNASFFFDAIIRQEPIREDKLNPEDNTEEFSLISDEDLVRWQMVIEQVKISNKALVGNIGGAAFGDIALVPAVNLKHPKGIRDIQEWYISTLMRQDYIHQVFEMQSEIAIQNLQKVATIIGDVMDVVFICGTDFGTQMSTFCSVDTYRELWMPYYKKVNDWIHANTTWKTFKHCCGSIKSLIPALIESGFDCLNPVQYSAANMDTQELKHEFGGRIVFWGGGIDTQHTLPFGTPDEVRTAVLNQCEILAPNGGFVFSSVHNIQANTPVENIVAMIDAVHEFSGRR
ncbi:methyltransferase [candidate division KSB1 bacterium]|nr:methyltransferase [candidate division KSB1 bacterium]